MADLAVREQNQLIGALAASGQLTSTGLKLDPDTDYETYERIGAALGRLRDLTAWALGDWVNFGEGRYGERVYQAATATGRSEQTLKNYGWVAGSFPKQSRRRDDLSWSHHEVVAKLPRDEQDEWLKRAASGNGKDRPWSVSEFRGAVQEPKPIEAKREPFVLSTAEVHHLIDAASRTGAAELAFKLQEGAVPSRNGSVAIAVVERPCPTCGGSGEAP